MKANCIIIDDSEFMSAVLSDLLDEQHPELELAGTAANGTEGLAMIRELKPDLVFLDVEMPDMTGFEMLGRLDRIEFQTIFVTAHSHYAIRAIRFNALDYLVKPIDAGELRSAVGRFMQDRDSAGNARQVKQALANLKTDKPEDLVLLLGTQEGELKLFLKEIVRVEGERNYSFIYLANGAKHLSSKTLGYFDEILSDKGFFRCHRSHLVNGRFIRSMEGREGFQLANSERLPISRRKGSDASTWFHNFTAQNSP